MVRGGFRKGGSSMTIIFSKNERDAELQGFYWYDEIDRWVNVENVKYHTTLNNKLQVVLWF